MILKRSITGNGTSEFVEETTMGWGPREDLYRMVAEESNSQSCDKQTEIGR